MTVTSIASASGWWVLLGHEGTHHRRPLVAWALLDDGRVVALSDWLTDDEPAVLEEGQHRHDVDFTPCRCEVFMPHSGGWDPRFCIVCGGLATDG